MRRALGSSLLLLTCPLVFAAPGAAEDDAKQLARQILRDTGVAGGLVVHLGCGNGKLTAALRASDSYLVQGLDTDAKNVAHARAFIRSQELYGRVSVRQFDGTRLPYAENVVNLLVIEDLGGTPMSEVTRVLCPGGVAVTLDSRLSTLDSFQEPWPDDVDEWTHFLHDASNNAVAQDMRVGPPRRMQWVADPLWSRSHEFISSLCLMVSGGGRVFYVVDEGVTSVTDPRLPERWMLIARDAFSGVLLWKRPLPDWRGDEWKSVSMRGRPGSVPRRIVAHGQRLYATLSHAAGLSVLEAATGHTLRSVDGTENTQEIALCDGTLVLRLAALGARRGKPRGWIVGVDADGEKILWRVRADAYLAQTLAAAGGRVVYSDGKETVCLSLSDGKELWRASNADAKRKRSRERTIILHGDLVLEAGGPEVVARSAETGQTLWTTRSGGRSMRPQDLFVAQGRVWHAAGDGIAGYDLVSGEPTKVIDPSSVQSAGHHLRCYRSKATERFLITQFRGAEFVSLSGEDHSNNDWVRGACQYGILPCNGMLYVPPNPCFCYPGVKLTGLLALAPKGEKIETDARPPLERGPAYLPHLATSSPPSPKGRGDDWPMYRHDPRRSGATACEVSPQVTVRWQVPLEGRLTPPVVAEGRVYVAAKDEHTLYAFSADDGRPLWHFTADGPIDSPPTVYSFVVPPSGGSRSDRQGKTRSQAPPEGGTTNSLVLFGCADGRVYCLRASDGRMAWRFRAAPSEQMIVAFDQLESPWRVHGSVLLTGGVVYCTAGRSTFLDGGIRIVGLDPQTGRVMHSTWVDTWSPTRKDAEGKPYIPSYHIEGSHSDLLVSDAESIYLTQMKFDRRLRRQNAPYVMPDPENPVVAMDITGTPFTADDPDLAEGFEYFREFHHYLEKAHPELTQQYKEKYGGFNLGDRRLGTHLMATAGFLDDSWFNRTYWMVSANWPGWYHAHRGAKCGNLIVVGDKRTYAVQAYPTRNRQSPLFTPGEQGYLLVADENDTEPVLDDATRGATKGMGYTRRVPPAWFDWVPVRIRGMVLAGKHLFVAGPPDVVDAADPMGAFEGRKGGVLRAVSAADGNTLAEIKLDAPPVFDGLIAAAGRLFMTTTDGHLVCLAE